MTKGKKGARLGQHFLTARWAAVSLARSVAATSSETILEIGPGKGALTRELLATGSRVVALEKDEILVERLKETFATDIAEGRFELISADIRDFVPSREILGDSYVLAANIPYYITGEIIRQFLTSAHQPRAMAILIQKEVAQRITASKASILSLAVKAYGLPRIVQKVSRTCFSPAPSVDSAILLVSTISRDFFMDLDENFFFDVVHAGFASKRKFLANNLGVKFGKDISLGALAASAVGEKARAEEVSLASWKLIAQHLQHSKPSN